MSKLSRLTETSADISILSGVGDNDGVSLGLELGAEDTEGLVLGALEIEGAAEGETDGELDGKALGDALGFELGADEMVG